MSLVLRGYGLILRPLRRASERQAGWLNDPRNVAYSEQRHRKHTVASCQTYINNLERDGHFIWAIRLDQRPFRHVGNVVAYMDWPNNVAELSILIEHRYQGTGLGTTAWRLVSDWLFQKPAPVHKIEAGCMNVNAPMVSILQKTGFFYEGCRSNHFLVDGIRYHLVQYGKLAK